MAWHCALLHHASHILTCIRAARLSEFLHFLIQFHAAVTFVTSSSEVAGPYVDLQGEYIIYIYVIMRIRHQHASGHLLLEYVLKR